MPVVGIRRTPQNPTIWSITHCEHLKFIRRLTRGRGKGVEPKFPARNLPAPAATPPCNGSRGGEFVTTDLQQFGRRGDLLLERLPHWATKLIAIGAQY